MSATRKNDSVEISGWDYLENVIQRSRDILRLDEGKYRIRIFMNGWRTVSTRYGNRLVIPVTYNDKDYVIMTSLNGSFIRELKRALSNVTGRPEYVDVEVKVVRIRGRRYYEMNVVEP